MTMDFKLDMTMMFAIHDALRRELIQIARITDRATDDPQHILRTAAGWQMFKSYLHVHHTCEDDTLWPVLEQSLASRPDDLALLAALEAEHAAIDPLLAAIDAALADRERGPEQLGGLTDTLVTVLTAHLRHEENDGLLLIDATATLEQWQRFGAEHGKRIGPEAPRYLPWLLDGLDESRTASVLANIPEPLRQAYRDEWLPAFAGSDRWGLVGRSG
jgi:hemerythrin-like domain-containing protein